MRSRLCWQFAWQFALIAAGILLAAPALQAQLVEPPIRIIFPFAPGGSGDSLARLIAAKMQAAIGRPVIVEDRSGAAGRIGVTAVKASAPDGDTLLLTPIAPMSIYPHVYAKLDYDPIKDFAAITQLGVFDFGIAVSNDLQPKTLKELIDWLRANPGQANYAIPGAGALPHFLGVMLGRAAKIDLRAVPYHGSAAGLTDVIANHIPIIITTTSDLVQMHKDGRIRVLATSDKTRSPFLPDVPTLRESGYDLVATGWYGMFAPAKTTSEIVARLNTIIVGAVQSPDVKDRLLAFGLAPTGTSAEEFARIVKADSEFWAPAVKASGFTPED
jgi:tripartite-type tricarboxylate transporter receptor subunit TctC